VKRALVLTSIVVASVLALAPAALASPFDRDCGTPQTGFIFGPANAASEPPWQVTGPWHIDMAPARAYRMAAHWPALEFGQRVSATRDVPCWVAQGIVTHAARSWPHWARGSGFVNVSTVGMGRPQYVGRFYCSGRTLRAPRVAALSCHTPAHDITASFTIVDNPYYSSGATG
jgi:hypothetical protein